MSHPPNIIEHMFDTMTHGSTPTGHNNNDWHGIDPLADDLYLAQHAATEPDPDEFDPIPPSLDTMEPGTFLAAILEHINLNRLSGHDQVIVLRAHQRMASHHQARTYAAMAEIIDTMKGDPDETDWAEEAAAGEISAALRLTRRATDTELAMALELAHRLPRVLEALTAGLIDPRRARAIAHHTFHLPDNTAQGVVDHIIDQAPGLTTGQLAARLRRLCIETNPDQAKDRYHHAVEQRSISTQATVDGTANLYATDLPPGRLAAAMTRINHLARGLRCDGETRTMDQLRADILLDLLNGTTTAAPGHGVVNLHVDLTTLAALDDHPGELAGYGPVIADIARQVAQNQTRSQWRWTCTDPNTGALIDAGTTRRRPTAAQRRYVQARDRTCVFPGCRMPATTSDLDHTTPHAHGGPTTTSNLAPLCRHHHNLKTNHGWTYQHQPNGNHTWTSQLGHTYTTNGQPP